MTKSKYLKLESGNELLKKKLASMRPPAPSGKKRLKRIKKELGLDAWLPKNFKHKATWYEPMVVRVTDQFDRELYFDIVWATKRSKLLVQHPRDAFATPVVDLSPKKFTPKKRKTK